MLLLMDSITQVALPSVMVSVDACALNIHLNVLKGKHKLLSPPCLNISIEQHILCDRSQYCVLFTQVVEQTS